jgi:hypothetical protein
MALGTGYVEYGFFVKITVPEFAEPDAVERDLATCLSFGQPELTKLYEIPAPRPETVVSVAAERL